MEAVVSFRMATEGCVNVCEAQMYAMKMCRSTSIIIYSFWRNAKEWKQACCQRPMFGLCHPKQNLLKILLLWSIPDPVTEPNLLTADDPDPGQDTVASDSLSALAVAKWSWDSRALSGSITWTSWTIEGEAAWSRQSGVRPRCEHSLKYIQSRTKLQ